MYIGASERNVFPWRDKQMEPVAPNREPSCLSRQHCSFNSIAPAEESRKKEVDRDIASREG